MQEDDVAIGVRVAKNHVSNRLLKSLSKPSLWLLIALFLAITFLQLAGILGRWPFITVTQNLGLTRYTVERVLYLLPIIWAGLQYGRWGAMIASLAAVAFMLPRALFNSPVREDALVETTAVFIVGNLMGYSLESLRTERKRRNNLEALQEKLQSQLKLIEANQKHLRFLLQYITKAQEEERKRVAREIHDDTIQALVVHSQQIYDLSTSVRGLPKSAVSGLEELRHQTGNIIQGLRRMSQDLRPAALDRLGLLPTLRQLANDISEHSGIKIEVAVTGVERRLPPEVELVLFRIVQEALRNIWKHAQAREAEINIEFAEKKTRVSVKDNGKGFEPDKVMDTGGSEKLGLAGMRERAELLGGWLTIDSTPGKGTTLTAELPV